MGTISPLSPMNNQSFMNLGKPTTNNTGVANPINSFGGQPFQGSNPWSLDPIINSGPGSQPGGFGGGGIISSQPPLPPNQLGVNSPYPGPGSTFGYGNNPSMPAYPLGGPAGGWGTPGGTYGYGNNPYMPASPLTGNPYGPGGTLFGQPTPPTNPASPYSGLITSGGTVGGYPGTGTTDTPSPYGNLGAQQQQTLANQLGKIYGVGTGALLSSTLANLGSTDNSYMQAYGAAMAPINAQNVNAMMTIMGNQGLSGNSSTSALAQGNFWSGVTSQEGLQEAGLQLQSQQDLINLEENIMPTAAKERTQGGILNYLGAMIQGIGNAANSAGSIGGAISGLIPTSAEMGDAAAAGAAAGVSGMDLSSLASLALI